MIRARGSWVVHTLFIYLLVHVTSSIMLPVRVSRICTVRARMHTVTLLN